MSFLTMTKITISHMLFSKTKSQVSVLSTIGSLVLQAYTFFFIFDSRLDCGYSLETPLIGMMNWASQGHLITSPTTELEICISIYSTPLQYSPLREDSPRTTWVRQSILSVVVIPTLPPIVTSADHHNS